MGKIDWNDIEDKLNVTTADHQDGLELSEIDKSRILEKRTQEFATELLLEEDVKSIDVLTFQLANEVYSIESIYVKEVLAKQKITPIPCTPDFISGVSNMRGKIHTVIDIRRFFDLSGCDEKEDMTIFIVETPNMCTGILVDKLLGYSTINLNELQEPLAVFDDRRMMYTRGIAANSLILLDIEKILADDKLCVNENIT